MTIPHSVEAEQALVHRLVLEPSLIPLVAGSLSPDDMYVLAYRNLLRSMIRLTTEGKPVDVVTLGDEGQEVDVLELSAGHHGPIESYIEIIKRKALDREVLTAVERVVDAVDSGDPNIIVTLQRALSDVLHRTTEGLQVSVFRAVEEYLVKLVDRRAGDQGLVWQVPGMDMVNPAGPGKFIILAARPSIGKTALAETIVENWCRQGKGIVLFCSLEMDKEELLDRAMARHSKVPAQRIIRGTLSDAEFETVQASAAYLKTLPLEYLDDPRATTEAIRSAAARAKLRADGGLAAIVVDYIQLLADDDRNDNPVWRVSKITRNLKAIAREYRVPVLALSQFNRELDKRGGDPILSDLRESGSIEQDADVVIAMKGHPGSGMRRIFVLKNRQGATGNFDLRLDGETLTWYKPGPWQQIYKDPNEPLPDLITEGLLW